MSNSTAISRRVRQTIIHLMDNQYENALIQIFPAIDATAQKRRPKISSVGQRIKDFILDEEGILSALGMNNIFVGCRVGKYTMADALYKFGRCPLAHEGELDSRLTFVEKGDIEIHSDKWILPVNFIHALTIVIITSPENGSERIDDNFSVPILGTTFSVNELWGSRDVIELHIKNKFRCGDIFEKCRNRE